ncbi:MAG: VWA domain-containing protein [Cohaesibacter sp.]|nr:VWA domain-containing protein [Cohaesibacter sp.]
MIKKPVGQNEALSLRQSQKGLAASQNEKAAVASFLSKTKLVRQAQKQKGLDQPTGRLVFALDATMSRQPSWDLACSLQSDMFVEAQRHGSLATQLVYFRGVNECKASRWTVQASDMIGWMERFECRAGRTQFGRVLQHIQDETVRQPVQAAVYVGDCLEEDADHLAGLAGEIALRSVPLFLFQEGDDPYARTVFTEIARITGGAYARFDGSAQARLATYLRSIAAYAASGRNRDMLPADLRKQVRLLSSR